MNIMSRAATLMAFLFMLLSLALPAQAGGQPGFFREWGMSLYANQSLNIDRDRLYGAGLAVDLAAPLYQVPHARLDLRLEGMVTTFWGHGDGLEASLLGGLRLYVTAYRLRPYLEAGMGPSLNGLNIEETSTSFNFLSYGGLGLRWPLDQKRSLELGYRLRHISNGGLKEPNQGVTSHQLQVGLSWSF